MPKKVLIFGNGQMGREVCRHLIRLSDCKITVVDPLILSRHRQHNVQYTPAHFEDVDPTPFDLVVGCVPASLGYAAAEHALAHGIDCVDLSFMPEDPFLLEPLAKNKGACLIPDAGLAPGLSNLFVGRALAQNKGSLYSAYISVGGVSQSPFMPYGYKVTWSVEDLEQEYIRPARHVRKHFIREDSPFSHRGYTWINGIQMESFVADGLRTLLRLKDRIAYMEENTLRWPGHMDAVEPLIENGTFVQKIKDKCDSGGDTVIFRVQTQKDLCGDQEEVTLIVQGHGLGSSAMAQTTAWTCATVADVVLSGLWQTKGVCPLEDLGANPIVFQAILDSLKGRGVHFTWS